MNAALFSGSEALLSGHRRGVDVGIAGVRREQMPWVSVSISMGTWLAAMSVVGWSVSGWVVVWFGGCRDQK